MTRPHTPAALMTKARQLRLALLAAGIVHSHEPALAFDDLPSDRQANWIMLAQAYLDIFSPGVSIVYHD